MASVNSRDSFIHLIAGGIAGTTAAIVTCPLEVVKTRLQSSVGLYQIQKMCVPPIASADNVTSQLTCKSMPYQRRRLNTQVLTISQFDSSSSSQSVQSTARPSAGVVQCLRIFRLFSH
uniref:Solute carrier family 25 member 36 n=1 Tax=Cacopsylla melanoneura TaxID=428564 RepID=A0A8D8USU6_9HEMI